MLFSSLIFIFFFLPVVLTVYLLSGRSLRYPLLLAANLFFYAWGEGRYVVLLLASIVANYFLGLAIGRSPVGSPRRKWVVAAAITINILSLAYYKYTYFLATSLLQFLGLAHYHGHLITPQYVHLPLGISFFTFQAISYLIDVYRGTVAPSTSLLNFALYKSFFPQLIAGPIVRYRDIAEQFKNHPQFNAQKFLQGAQRFVIGLGKKVLIANSMASVVDPIFSLHAASLSPALAWLGALCYTAQIYFDFSGYSDMAIGLAAMFGFSFLENFNFPYISTSIQDFWRRWHISLSSWFRDYLYIPLGGNRLGKARTVLNQLIVFLLCGLWHGAAWTFVLWGAWHGCFLALERFRLGKIIAALPRPAQTAYTLVVVIIGWVIFRSGSLHQAGSYLLTMSGLTHAATAAPWALYMTPKVAWTLVAAVIASLPVREWWNNHVGPFIRQPGAWAAQTGEAVLRNGFLAAIFLLSSASLASGTYNPFIYFRF